MSLEFLGNMVESSRVLDRGRELHVPAEHMTYTAMYGLDPGMIARAMSSRPLWALGYPDRADERARETLALARAQRQPVTLAFALVVAQGIHLYRGEFDEAVSMGDEIVALSREYELKQETEWGRSFQGAALAGARPDERGHRSAERQPRRAAGDRLRPRPHGVPRAPRRDARGRGTHRRGPPGRRRRLRARGARRSRAGIWPSCTACAASCWRLSGDHAAAEESLRLAIARAVEQQAKSFELRAATGLAKLLLARGRREDARAALAPVYDWFTEGHTTRDLVAARAILDEIGL